MSRPATAARRSGDPRRRAQTRPPRTGPGRRAVAVALVAVAVLLALAYVALRPAADEPDGAARDHAEAACDLTSKAREAGQVETRARYAAAMLLLDRAIIESARAAESDPALAELDASVQSLHTAAHRGDPGQWKAALGTALAACRTATG